jgi:hypothetical protein
VLLVLIGMLCMVAAFMFAESFRRQDAVKGLAGMSVMIVAGIVAAVYGAVAG